MNPDTLTRWTNLVTAALPLIQVGELAATEIVSLFHSANPTATNDELNAALGELIVLAQQELDAIAAERKDAGGE